MMLYENLRRMAPLTELMSLYIAAANGGLHRGTVVGYKHSEGVEGLVHVTVLDCGYTSLDSIYREMYTGFFGASRPALGPSRLCLDVEDAVLDVHGHLVFKEPARCRIDLGSHYPDEVAVRVPLTIECSSPTSRVCTWSGYIAGNVIKVDAYTWYEYWELLGYRNMLHVYASSRWVGGCGAHNRVYVREDGALVLSHDEAGYEGVHVVYFDHPVWELIGFAALDELIRHVDKWRRDYNCRVYGICESE